MLIFIDLDGTLINTVHPSWKPYKDGQLSIENCLDQVPFIHGAKEFIQSRTLKGDDLIVVSDSHPRYVIPICKMLGVECLSLADKPNENKLNEYLLFHPTYKSQVEQGEGIFIGDTKLDIELGRKMGIKTIWFLPYQITDNIKDERDGIGDKMICRKMGPTYEARNFQQIEAIIESPLDNLYSIEAKFLGYQSDKSIRLNDYRYRDGSYACIRCLARQEQGSCDRYSCAVKYILLSKPDRTSEFILSLAMSVSSFLNQKSVKNEGWDYFTYLTDKQSTVPKHKMKEVFDLVETDIKKIQLLEWAHDVQGSLRDRSQYRDRQVFLEKYLSVIRPKELELDMKGDDIEKGHFLNGKNIVVLDDQLTTGATAFYIIHKLKEKGARNILFITLFQMILPVTNNIICPRCEKNMLIKIRRSDGHRFYSCTPPKFNGDGCGYIIDISNQ